MRGDCRLVLMPDVGDGTDALGHGVLGDRETGLEGGLLTGAAHLGMRGKVSCSAHCARLDDLSTRVDSDTHHDSSRPLAVGHGFGPVLKGVADEPADAGLASEDALAGVTTCRSLLSTAIALA